MIRTMLAGLGLFLAIAAAPPDAAAQVAAAGSGRPRHPDRAGHDHRARGSRTRARCMQRAHGALICPRIFQAGSSLGGQGGGCVLVGRNNGNWSYPAFYSFSQRQHRPAGRASRTARWCSWS